MDLFKKLMGLYNSHKVPNGTFLVIPITTI
ncbi:MAG: hypothetical protein ACFWUG_20405 [Rahnella inusitata]|jgi:hypothetical protein